jgi:hypothetical protein
VALVQPKSKVKLYAAIRRDSRDRRCKPGKFDQIAPRLQRPRDILSAIKDHESAPMVVGGCAGVFAVPRTRRTRQGRRVP